MDNKKHEVPLEIYIRNIFYSIRYSAEKNTAAYNITSSQGHLLEIIFDGLVSGEQISRKYLEDKMLLKGSSITSLLNGLEKKGFINRNHSNSDGRALNISLTEKGTSAITQVKLLFIDQDKKISKGMTTEEVDLFRQLLEKAYRNISEEL